MGSPHVVRKGSGGFIHIRLFPVLSFLLLVAGGVLYYKHIVAGRQSAPTARKEAPPVPVSVARVVQKTIPREIRAIGNVKAYSTVGVKALVSGELARVWFQEGQDVKKGDMLFTIDPRPFEASVKEVEANLARDEAKAKNANADAARYARLTENHVASAEEYETMRTNAEALRAGVLADQAVLETAKLNLEYCSIKSPIEGRTGNLTVNQGNVVKANDQSLVTINQISPIYVSFAVPEQYLIEIKKYMAESKLKVTATIPGDEAHPAEGVVTFLDNEVDTATGTIQLKGTFPNQDKRLWPGQFMTVVLTLTSERDVLLVPSEAIQTGQKGQYVFVVKPDSTVEYRPVVVERTYGDYAVVTEGLKVGETVVTDGQLRLVPGSRAEVKTGPDSGSDAGP